MCCYLNVRFQCQRVNWTFYQTFKVLTAVFVIIQVILVVTQCLWTFLDCWTLYDEGTTIFWNVGSHFPLTHRHTSVYVNPDIIVCSCKRYVKIIGIALCCKYKECLLQIKWGLLRRTVFNNKIRLLQRTRRNTIGRRSTRVRVICRAFPLWFILEKGGKTPSNWWTSHRTVTQND